MTQIKENKKYFLTLENLNLNKEFARFQEMPLKIGHIKSKILSYFSKVWAFLPSYERNHLLRIHTDWIYGGD
jgi:hypothetical protein